jgi:hypothetical protein
MDEHVDEPTRPSLARIAPGRPPGKSLFSRILAYSWGVFTVLFDILYDLQVELFPRRIRVIFFRGESESRLPLQPLNRYPR